MPIHVYCRFNLGDHLINFIFFHKIKEYIEKKNIIIHYYCSQEYHKNLLTFKCSENIKLLNFDSYKKKAKYYGYELWQSMAPLQYYVEDQLCIMFNDFLNFYKIPISVDSFEYKDDDLFKRFEVLDNKYKNIDILIINSKPRSGQYNYDKTSWDNFIIQLRKSYKVATSAKVEGDDSIIPLDNICVKDIAAIALNVKIIITINTGPSISFYNTDILNNVEAIYMFSGKQCYYHFKTRKIQEMQNIEDLSFLLK